jgi:signal transduction histidine kinase
MQRFLNVQEEERERISRELHDNLGQHLAAILLHIRRLENESHEAPGVHQFFEERGTSMKGLDQLGGMVNDLIDITHRLAWELRPAVLDNIGLHEALEQYVRAWPEHGVTAHFISDNQGNITTISASTETALYRVVQEALSNVKRHAHASIVSVILERQQQSVTAIVEDNGRGFRCPSRQ